jgi:hypothetical protein
LDGASRESSEPRAMWRRKVNVPATARSKKMIVPSKK